MIAQYAKQAWHQARTNVAYTVIYIAGVALTMLFVMVMAMVLYVKIAPVYPENRRSDTYYINRVMLRADQMAMLSNVGRYFYDEYLSKLENVDAIAFYQASRRDFVTKTDGSRDFEVMVKSVSDGFFDIYDFDFLAGAPFLPEHFVEEPNAVVITNQLADRLFGGSADAVGRNVDINKKSYRVVGVVTAPSWLTSHSYAQIFMPPSKPSYDSSNPTINDLNGGLSVVMTAKDGEALKREMEELVHKLNNSTLMHNGGDDEKWTINLYSQPTPHWKSGLLSDAESGDEGVNRLVWLYVVIVLVLLVVPALNLSGLIGGRMDTRLSELGIRKTYGAPRSSLMRQVIYENFLLTIVGAVIGMMAAWVVVVSCRSWIFSIFESDPLSVPAWIDITINGDMIFAPALFVIMLVLCLVVNLMSAIVPALIYMRKPIVTSLYEKR
ncbi:MAG: ABC transporter permease [Muribaculum sp.]|nr:ABC transporter permease [Muribaculum sp.]